MQLCMAGRAKKVVVGLTLVALIAATIKFATWHLYERNVTIIIYISNIVFHAVLPVTVLIINAIVVREVRRRASSDAASNLGIQHHQSTSSNSAVPTVMLVTTSLIYVLINGLWFCAHMAYWVLEIHVAADFMYIAAYLFPLVYAYNFYVYLITGKQFRSELYKLFFGCCPFSSSSSAVAAAANHDVQRKRSQDFVWGCTFSSKKLTTFFSRRPQNTV